MKRYHALLLALGLTFGGTISHAQSAQEEEDKGYITTLIEDNLSGVSRDVNITGFSGALSSKAQIAQLTISDSDGIWLTLEDIVLDWNRSALLRGVIDVSELSAARIIIARKPISDPQAPSPEAQPFSLPDLPVAINLDALDIARVELGSQFLGEAVALSITGAAALSGGQGEAKLTAARLDGARGQFDIQGSFDNATTVLDLLLSLSEDADGIAARVLGIPGRPSVDLEIAGAAPLDEFSATIALATDGQDRITGEFGLLTTPMGRGFRVDIGGDVTALFNPDYRDFFGTQTQLRANGAPGADGGFALSELRLQTQSLDLQGAARLTPEGWPAMLNLTGAIADASGAPVLLPLSGPKRYVDKGSIALNYDAAAGTGWQLEGLLSGFDRPGLLIEDITLMGGGTIIQGDGGAVGQVTADLDYRATGITLDDARMAQAMGGAINGNIAVTAIEGAPIELTAFTLRGPGIEADAVASIKGSDDGFETVSDVLLKVQELGRFSGLAGRDLRGVAELAISSTITPLDSLFDILVTGNTENLGVGIAQVDSLLRGAGTIAAVAKRDTTGTRLEALTVQTPEVKLTATADLTSGGSDANFDFTLREASVVEPRISGPVTLRGNAQADAEGLINFDLRGSATDAEFTALGDVQPALEGPRRINAKITANVAALATYADLAGRPLAGGITAELSGFTLTDLSVFDATISGDTRNIAIGVPQVDQLLRGNGQISGTLGMDADRQYRLNDFAVTTPAVGLRADATGGLTGAANAQVNLRLNDAGQLVAGLSGPITVQADARRGDTGPADVNATISGAGIDTTLSAQIAPDTYEIDGNLDARINDLRPIGALIGKPLRGGLNGTVAGSALPDLSRLDADIALRTQDIAIGNPAVDLLLRGAGSLNASLARNGQQITVRNVSAATPNISVTGSLDGSGSSGRGQFNARLRDIGIFTDTLSGPVNVEGTAALTQAGRWEVVANGTGPGGIAGQVNGQLLPGGGINATVAGRAPLGLANPFLEPRRLDGIATIDLAINGAAELNSVSGTINLDGARLSAPNFGVALEDIRGGVSLASGNARLDVSGTVSSGGSVSLTGPVALSGGYNADLAVALRDVVLRDPELYSTSVNGTITARGALTGGAAIGGTLNLGQTDVQVPSSGVGSLGDLPDVRHIGESAAVQRTIARAGANEVAQTSTNGGRTGPTYPLDLTINAPSRIFIRGRGLDAELGGALSLTGTTANVIPVGQFNLIRGRIDILQQRFDLTEGTASLQGDFEPYLRLVAATEARTGTVVRIVVEGPASAPEVSFTSTPELPQDEVLSQLIFGRDLASISPLQAVQLAAAVGTLAGRGGGGIIDTFREGIGLDDFDVTTDEDGNAAVRAGKYLSENVYTDVTIASTGETEVNINLDITSDITAKGTVTADGETSIGIFYERDY